MDLFEHAAIRKKSRAKQIFARFSEFHSSNPDVWQLFERFTLELLAAGRLHYGSGAIFERIRWHVDVETKGDSAKLNNNFRAYYARMFEVAHPQHTGFFRNRKRTSEARPAQESDKDFIHTGSPGDEALLAKQLETLLSSTKSEPAKT